jgi:hypothetical protein
VVATITPLALIQPGQASSDAEEEAEAARLAAYAEQMYGEALG